jgi:UDP-3-O-[3-hydroxymyristoyl] N-acetylglucosamine deacetylase
MNQIGKHKVAEQMVSTAHPEFDAGQQTTLLRPINCVGIALHSGEKVSLTLKPAGAGSGVVFYRTDVPGSKEILARWDNVVDTRMCTVIGNEDGLTVGTVEHLMAALSGCHVDNVIIEVNGPEVPVMDGSAQPFVFLIECAGLQEQNIPRRVIEILKPVRVEIGDKLSEIVPSENFTVGFEIDFEEKAVARQQVTVSLINGTFKKEVARARTFGFMHEVEQLRAVGLALGGSLDNAVVVEGDKILNEGGLRYEDEFVRHKVLDAVGDLALSGAVMKGHYRGVRAGHALTNQLLRALFADPTAWRYMNEEAAVEEDTHEAELPEMVAASA